MTISLRITGKNSDGEYWLHLDGSPQKARLNLGDPAGMITPALLMAASGHSYISADAPALVALVEALRPFASCADELDHETRETGREYPDDEWAKFRLLVSDYRRARAALAAWKEGK